jgi:5'-3' exonuclease
MKPVYVFDGKPPDMKSGEVRRRSFSLAPLNMLIFSNFWCCSWRKDSKEELKLRKMHRRRKKPVCLFTDFPWF